MNERELNRVTKEVKKVLRKNEHLVRNLAETIVEELRRFSSGEATSEDARDAARKIANAFDLNEDFLRVVEEYSKRNLTSFVSIHFNPSQNALQEVLITKTEVAVQKPRRHNSLRRIDPRR